MLSFFSGHIITIGISLVGQVSLTLLTSTFLPIWFDSRVSWLHIIAIGTFLVGHVCLSAVEVSTNRNKYVFTICRFYFFPFLGLVLCLFLEHFFVLSTLGWLKMFPMLLLPDISIISEFINAAILFNPCHRKIENVKLMKVDIRDLPRSIGEGGNPAGYRQNRNITANGV